jgi:hypothetical protein
MKLKPCPFCECERLYAGVHDSTSDVISCMDMSCRAKIVMQWPEYWPKGLKRPHHNKFGDEYFKALRNWNLKRIAKRWTRRSAGRRKRKYWGED